MSNGQFIRFELEKYDITSPIYKLFQDFLKKNTFDLSQTTDFVEQTIDFFAKRADDLKDDLNYNTVQIIPEPYNQNIDFAKDLYVSGYCGLLQKARREGGQDSFHISLADEALKAFLRKPITEYTSVHERLAFVCGEPGAGKSTLARKITYDLIADYEKNHIKNKLDALTDGLILSVWNSLKSGFNRLINVNIYHAEADDVPALCHFIPLGRIFYDSSHRKGDIVTFTIPPFTKYLYLDGLDEVAFQSDDNSHTPHQEGNIPSRFLCSIKDFLDRHTNIKIIIGLRTALYTELKEYISVGENTHILMRDAPCYYLLPLYNQEQEGEKLYNRIYNQEQEVKKIYNISVKTNGTIKDLREDYIQKILKIVQKDSQYDDILKTVKDEKYHAVSSEPILFMFLLRAICCDKNDWKHQKIQNMAQLYDAVFEDFYIRERDKQESANRLVQACKSYKEFNKVLEVIALCAYSEGGKIASREKVIDNLKTTFPDKNYHDYFSADKADVKNYAGVAMFYFGIHQQGNIEFLHKTFYEYFVARGILSLFERASGGDKKAQQAIMALFAKKPMIVGNNIVKFLYDTITLKIFEKLCNPNPDFSKSVAFVKNVLKGEIPFSLRADNLFYEIVTIWCDMKKISYMLMGLINLLGILSSHSNNKKEHYDLDFPAFLLKDILYFYIAGREQIYFICINFLNCKDMPLERANLVEANLNGTNLVGANLVGANLWRAALEEANLKGASLERANLKRAKLKGANLEGTNLGGVYYNQYTQFSFKNEEERRRVLKDAIFVGEE